MKFPSLNYRCMRYQRKQTKKKDGRGSNKSMETKSPKRCTQGETAQCSEDTEPNNCRPPIEVISSPNGSEKSQNGVKKRGCFRRVLGFVTCGISERFIHTFKMKKLNTKKGDLINRIEQNREILFDSSSLMKPPDTAEENGDDSALTRNETTLDMRASSEVTCSSDVIQPEKLVIKQNHSSDIITDYDSTNSSVNEQTDHSTIGDINNCDATKKNDLSASVECESPNSQKECDSPTKSLNAATDTIKMANKRSDSTKIHESIETVTSNCLQSETIAPNDEQSSVTQSIDTNCKSTNEDITKNGHENISKSFSSVDKCNSTKWQITSDDNQNETNDLNGVSSEITESMDVNTNCESTNEMITKNDDQNISKSLSTVDESIVNSQEWTDSVERDTNQFNDSLSVASSLETLPPTRSPLSSVSSPKASSSESLTSEYVKLGSPPSSLSLSLTRSPLSSVSSLSLSSPESLILTYVKFSPPSSPVSSSRTQPPPPPLPPSQTSSLESLTSVYLKLVSPSSSVSSSKTSPSVSLNSCALRLYPSSPSSSPQSIGSETCDLSHPLS